MKSTFFSGALALSLTLSGVAMAADLPVSAPPPPVVDPLAVTISPIGTAIGAVINGVVITPIAAIVSVILPPPPPAPVVARY